MGSPVEDKLTELLHDQSRLRSDNLVQADTIASLRAELEQMKRERDEANSKALLGKTDLMVQSFDIDEARAHAGYWKREMMLYKAELEKALATLARIREAVKGLPRGEYKVGGDSDLTYLYDVFVEEHTSVCSIMTLEEATALADLLNAVQETSE